MSLDAVRVARDAEVAASAAAVRARAELEAAIVDAVRSGASQSAIARELGVSRQAVQQIVVRATGERISDD